MRHGVATLGAAAFGALAAVVWTAGVQGAPRRAPPTYHRDVEPILRRNCVECHRRGDVAPMALTDATSAAEWAEGIVDEIEAGAMPPWRPTRGVGRFVGERGLTSREIDTLRAWRDAGAPAGVPRRNVRKVPEPTSGWVLGEPDAVLDYGEDFVVPQGGDDVYRCFPVRNPFGRDVFLDGIDVQPGDRRVVHHVVLYLDPAGESIARDEADAGPGYECFGGPETSQPLVLGGWAPGNRAQRSPRGTALRLRRDDVVVIQLHYHPIGEAAPERTTVGLHLSNDPNPDEMLLVPVANTGFTIPAGATAHEVVARLSPSEVVGLPISARAFAVLPHMHLLGRSIEVDVELPDGTEQRLVEIRDWDFDWQDTYTFRTPVPIPAGAAARVRSVFDNSAANPQNPNSPPVDVSWGERTVDEMCLAFIAVTLGPAQVTPPPEVRDVAIDSKNRLVVRAKRLLHGGRIEIDGTAVDDSAAPRGSRLVSTSGWQSLVPPGEDVEIRVRRGDGRLSRPRVLRR